MSLTFRDTSNGKTFIQSNESIQKFLSKVNAESSKESYSYNLYQSCKWANKTPDQLLAERKTNDGYATLDLVQKFIQGAEKHHNERFYQLTGKFRQLMEKVLKP